MLVWSSLIISCWAIRLDPDSLPSIEVLLVPPDHPFPQVQEELERFRSLREARELSLLNTIKSQFASAKQSIITELNETLNSVGPLPGSLMQLSSSRDIENVAIDILPIKDAGLTVKEEIQAIDEKTSKEEQAQVQQFAKEIGDVKQVFLDAVKAGVKKYFQSSKSPRRTSVFLQTDSFEEDKFGIKPVLNIRVGSSSLPDGLDDGSSFPSVVGMVDDELRRSLEGENVLLNSALFYTRQLGLICISFINRRFRIPPGHTVSSFLDPSTATANMLRQSLKYLPPGVPRFWRKKSMRHSTVELKIHPPESDSELDREVLRAMLKSEETVRKARLKAFTKSRKRLLKEIVDKIDDSLRRAATAGGYWMAPVNVPSFTLNQLLFGNSTGY
jgi:hypothetical protein